MNKTFSFLASALVLLVFNGCTDDLFTPDVGVKYRVTFEGNWSEGNFPTDFPSNDHFSDFIGLTHDGTISLFDAGGMATEGMEVMAETGATTPLDQEVFEKVETDAGYDFIINGAPGRGTGKREFVIYVDEAHPLVSIVSMIAPSPDWFISVHGYSLWQNERWVESITIPASTWDAGTDSGTTYTSEDADTEPQEPILLLTAPPLGNGTEVNPPLGYFKFELRD
jgi:hypothetical protein